MENEILFKEKLAPDVKLIKVEAPLIAKKAKSGQFIILRVDEDGERIPLTLIDADPKEGTITLVFKEIGASTKKLGTLEVGDRIHDLVGPLQPECNQVLWKSMRYWQRSCYCSSI